MNTERPDIVAANLMEGKIAILTDGTPQALLLPITFWTAFQAALYVAITTFHPQLLPTNFLLSITSAREGVPFPAVIEALLMEFLFEGLREAGVRLPKAVGSAVSIVGALVIGEAAVTAGIVSAPMVIIVTITGIASFVIPRYNMGITFRILHSHLRRCILSVKLGRVPAAIPLFLEKHRFSDFPGRYSVAPMDDRNRANPVEALQTKLKSP